MRLLHGGAPIPVAPAEGPVPFFVPSGIGLDQPEIIIPRAVRPCRSEEDVAAIARLLAGEAPIRLTPAEGPGPRLTSLDGLEGEEDGGADIALLIQKC